MNKCFIGMFIVVNSIWHEKVLPKPFYFYKLDGIFKIYVELCSLNRCI